MTAPTSPTPIEQHPDLLELRARSEQATATLPAQAAEALAVLAGLYLTVSPWVAGFDALTPLAISNLITGIAYTLCVAGFGTAYERTHAMSWAAAGIGLWTIISPWAIAGNVDTARTIISNVIAGSVALVLALVISAMAPAARVRQAVRSYGGMTGGAHARGSPGA
ncbi:SPW repeat protein [Streptomyces sp. 8N616]|uniref:SPW repeat protein n=1 Tax=Streptomyces sp. 8N616 TaxID=3457414 RepID=UPI003FCF274E